MKAVTPQKDKARIRKSQQRIDNLTISIIQQCLGTTTTTTIINTITIASTANNYNQFLDIETKVKSIIELKNKCVDSFNFCDTFDERNLCFDELTATLGDDVAGREGFLPGTETT